MKKHILKPACFLLSLLLMCLGAAAVAAEQAAAPQAEALAAYRGVLLDNSSYTQCDIYDNLATDVYFSGDISLWYGYSFDPALHYVAFSITDLDSDGSPEVLLKLSEDFGFELLRYEGGKVYGFPFLARAMEAVTTDSVIHGSNGAQNFGWYQVRFSQDKMETVVVCWEYDDLGPDLEYYIGAVRVSENVFKSVNEELWLKESLTWSDYTQENIDAALPAH